LYLGFLISLGKKSLMEGFYELFAFVKALDQMDHLLAMRRVAIQYGIVPKNKQDVAHSIGWIKPTKRQRAAVNDGRPPDTTDALLDCPQKKAKLRRPPKSKNINRSMHTTYLSYAASKEEKMKNHGWLASAMELLYTVYSPLWLRSPGGHLNDLFHLLVSHFTSQTTHKLQENKHLKSILTCGLNSLFNEAQQKHPQTFISGQYASCDYFFSLVLDPQLNSAAVLQKIFSIQETRKYLCPLKIRNHVVETPHEEQVIFALQVTQLMYEQNQIPSSNPESLIAKWTSSSLDGASCLVCKRCSALRAKKKANCKIPNSQQSRPSSSRLNELSLLSFPQSGPPLHVYFQVDAVPIADDNTKLEFMGQMNWPFKLNILGKVYTLISRGYLGHNHYWGKVLRTVRSVTGVWLHNDLENAGYAQMVDLVPGTISGAHPNTSWLIYSQTWNQDEAAFVKESISQIRRNNPSISSGFPFTHMKNLLNISYDRALTMEMSNPPKASNSLMITSDSTKKQLDDNSHFSGA
jgi:hypothetical protein